MSSSWSPSLKIQLMATGENTTTWGSVTNNNFEYGVEQAIVGSADVAFVSSDVTLSLSDTNASQTARNMRLRCTGNPGSPKNLVVPSTQKAYIIQNDCDAAITVKTAAGSGVAVAAGKTMWVYCNSVNVVDVVTHLTSLTLATPLAATQGGTGTNTNFTAGSVVFASGTGVLGQDNANLFWDDSNNRLGIGTTTPATRLDVQDSTGTIRAKSTTGTNQVYMVLNNTAGDFYMARDSSTGSGFGAGNYAALLWAEGNYPMVFATNSTERMRIDGAGGVTITGGLALSTALNVANGGTGVNTLTANAVIVGNGTSSVTSVSPGTNGNVLTSNGTAWVSQAPASGGGVSSITGTANQVIASASTGAVTLSLPQSINTTSNVRFASFGVNTNASGTAGEIRATNNITAFYSSDARFKENIQDIEGALDAVCAIGGKIFDWSDQYIAEHGGEDGYFVRKRDFGVIAQDVMKNFPLGARARPDETLAVDYEKMCALAFQAIKELRAEVEALKNGAK